MNRRRTRRPDDRAITGGGSALLPGRWSSSPPGGLWLANRDHSLVGEPAVTVEPAGPAPLAFRMPEASPDPDSCPPLEEYIPDPATMAFAVTVSDVASDAVWARLDRWYTAPAIQIVPPPDPGDDVEITITVKISDGADGAIKFVQGERYLVSVLDGEVLICGISGPATPELEALYEQWYGS